MGRPKKTQSEEGGISNSLIKTSIMAVSCKLQKNGFNVTDITGGVIGQPKTHYFKTTLDEVKKVLNDDEMQYVEEVKEIIPTNFIFSDLKEKLKDSPQKSDLMEGK